MRRLHICRQRYTRIVLQRRSRTAQLRCREPCSRSRNHTQVVRCEAELRGHGRGNNVHVGEENLHVVRQDGAVSCAHAALQLRRGDVDGRVEIIWEGGGGERGGGERAECAD